MLNIINIIKQKLRLRLKSDIQADLKDAKEQEKITKQAYAESEAKYHDKIRLREEAEGEYKSAVNSQRYWCHIASRDWRYRVNCDLMKKERDILEEKFNKAIDEERIAKSNMEVKKRDYKKAINRREILQKEYDSYRWII